MACQPKDLRKALPNYLARGGLANDITEQYIGHTPKSVTARYVARIGSVSHGKREALEEGMALFRKMVVEPLEKVAGNAVEIAPICTR